MTLEGTVTNVTNFGAFIDIGVHQDGLVHISALSDKFVKDPREAVKTGDIVRVKVMDVDVQRKRIGLSMRLNDDITIDRKSDHPNRQAKRHPKSDRKSAPAKTGTLATLFEQAAKKPKKRL